VDECLVRHHRVQAVPDRTTEEDQRRGGGQPVRAELPGTVERLPMREAFDDLDALILRQLEARHGWAVYDDVRKAEFRKDERVLELYWEKGVPSSAYVPEDERPRTSASTKGTNNATESARERAKERYESQRKQTHSNTMSTDDVDALFDDDDSASEITEMAAGVSLTSPVDRSTQSLPPSPGRNGGTAHGPTRTQSDSRIAKAAGNIPENNLTDKEKYLSYFKLREEGGEYIQDVTEMTRVPVILKTDLTKSPPCLTIRSMNPYAL